MSQLAPNVNQIYKRTEVIGRGKFGTVYKGIHRSTKQVYAIKVLNLDTAEDEVKDVQQEVQFLSNLKQVPNVTHYYGSYLNGTKLWIIMDHCAGGSLRTLLRPGKLEEKYIGVIVREVLIALQYIHKQNVIHRDIKAANVLITNEGKVQLCDFGVAAQLTATSVRRNTMAGTPYWMAPEVIMEGTSYDVKADIWSLGITIYEIATGNPPYCDKEAMRAMQLITKSKPPRLEGKQYSPMLKEIIALCLDENPTERLSAEDLLKTKFIKFSKNYQTSILKEIISRYLLWREKKSSRESIMMNVEDDAEENEIKWDFDSLSSNEYILENDINLNDININDDIYNNYENGGNDYDDEDDEFMTGYPGQRTNYHGTINHTNQFSSKNTVTYTTNVTSTLKDNGARKEAPKSLLKLFEEENEDDEESGYNKHQEMIDSNYELPQITSSVGLHTLQQQSSTTVTSRISTPIKEIEIPNFEEMESFSTSNIQHDGSKSRSRANTLAHTQSTTALETRKALDPSLQRRPTLTTSMTSAPLPTSQAPQMPPPPPPSSSSVSTGTSTISSSTTASTAPTSITQQSLGQPVHMNIPPAITRATPSPKRDLSRLVTSPSSNNLNSVNISPNKTSSISMRAIQSPPNQSPLLQPLNGSSMALGTPDHPSSLASASSGTNQQTSSNSVTVKRNYQNLRLQMPTPTAMRFPKVLHSGSNLEERSDETVNQFGVNVSSVPMTMTPLAEKPQLQFAASTSNINPTIPNTSGSNIPPTNNNSSVTTPAAAASSSSIPQPKRKNTLTQPSLMPFISNNQRAGSSLSSSHSSTEGGAGNINNSTLNTSMDSKILMPGIDISLFMDDGFNKEKLNEEVLGLLSGFTNLLGLMEDKLTNLND